MSSPLNYAKRYEDLAFKYFIALGTKCGGLENVKAVLREEKNIIVHDIPSRVFDDNGRRIPYPELMAGYCDPDPEYEFVHDDHINGSEFFERKHALASKLFPKMIGISAVDFRTIIGKLHKKIETDSRFKNLLSGTWLPIIFPSFLSDFLRNERHYITTMNDTLLKVVLSAYKERFRKRKVVIDERAFVSGLKIIRGSRHLSFLEKFHSGGAGIFFPYALQGFSHNACIEQMNTLPKNFYLAGGLETCTALAMYSSDLARSHKCPSFDLGALTDKDEHCSFGFSIKSNGIEFYHAVGRRHCANANVSSGLVYTMLE